jgi:hypothetical protein
MKEVCEKIAVLLSATGEIASAENADVITVYKKNDDGWLEDAAFPARLDYTSPTLLHKSLRDLVMDLEDCRIVVGETISGIPYHVLCRHGFAVFEADLLTDELLTDIQKDFEEAEETMAEEDVPTRPMPTFECGHYALDLIRLQEVHPEISSKMALRDFLKGDFKELRLTCTHVPPWLANDVALAGATMLTTQSGPGRYKVSIRK